MNYLYKIMPKDLAYIIDEYAKDRTEYDKVLWSLKLYCSKSYFARDDKYDEINYGFYGPYGNHVTFSRTCIYLRFPFFLKRDVYSHEMTTYINSPRKFLTELYSDKRVINNRFLRGSTMSYTYTTPLHKKYNKVIKEMIYTFKLSRELHSYRGFTTSVNYDGIQNNSVTYFLRGKKKNTDVIIRSMIANEYPSGRDYRRKYIDD